MASPLDSLISLGFTPLEAEVYVCLVQDSPATGYRIAQTVGRPVAGIYKTIESLANKGQGRCCP
jgi:HTH-type transcriptional regulator, sugar sensing transcriptional regulator